MSSEKTHRRLKGPDSEQVKDVWITNAELEALFATPKTIVAAPATGYHLVFRGAAIRKPANADAQTVPGAGTSDFAIKYTSAAGLQVAQCETTGFMDQTSEQVRYIYPFDMASGISSITPATGAALVLQTLIADLSAGDAVLSMRVFYQVMPDAF